MHAAQLFHRMYNTHVGACLADHIGDAYGGDVVGAPQTDAWKDIVLCL